MRNYQLWSPTKMYHCGISCHQRLMKLYGNINSRLENSNWSFELSDYTQGAVSRTSVVHVYLNSRSIEACRNSHYSPIWSIEACQDSPHTSIWSIEACRDSPHTSIWSTDTCSDSSYSPIWSIISLEGDWNLGTNSDFVFSEDWFDFWCITPLSAISCRPVLVVEEAGVPGEYHRPRASNWQTFSTCGCESSAPFFGKTPETHSMISNHVNLEVLWIK